jgi:hypothetical protein
MSLIGLRKLQRRWPEIGELDHLRREMKRQKNDRVAAILGSNLLDLTLKAVLTIHVPNRDAAPELFEDFGPLSTLDAKIKMAHAMDLLGPQTRKNLGIIRTVRNVFAHTANAITFDTPEVAEACNALMLPIDRTPFTGGTPKFDTPREKYTGVAVITSSLLVWNTAIGEMEQPDGRIVKLPKPP